MTMIRRTAAMAARRLPALQAPVLRRMTSTDAAPNHPEPSSWRTQHFRPAGQVVPQASQICAALEAAAIQAQQETLAVPEFTHFHVTLRRSHHHSRKDFRQAVNALGLRWLRDRVLVPLHPIHAGNILKVKEFLTVHPVNVIKDLHWQELERLIDEELHYRSSQRGIPQAQVPFYPETSVIRIHRKRPAPESAGFAVKRRMSDAVAAAQPQPTWNGSLEALGRSPVELSAESLALLQGLAAKAVESQDQDVYILE